MKLAVQTGIYQKAGIPLMRSLDHVHELGFKYIDVPGFRQFMPQFLPVSEQLAIARRMEQLDITPMTALYMTRANPGSSRPEERMAAFKEIQPSARWIHRIGGSFLMFCEACGKPNYEEDLDKNQALENSIETLQRLCEWCDKELSGLKVLLEMIPYGGNLCSIESMKYVCDKVGAPNLFINVDIGHCNLQKTNGKRFKLGGEKVINIHISDNDNYGDEGWIKEEDKVIGTGNTHIREYMEELVKMDIVGNARKAGLDDCYATIECNELFNGQLPNPDWAIMKSRDWILANLPYFRDPALGLD